MDSAAARTWSGSDDNIVARRLSYRFGDTLQIISSQLMDLGGLSQTETFTAQVDRVRTRIDILARLHRRLALARRDSEPFEDYCRSICWDLIQSLGRSDLATRFSMETMILDRDAESRFVYLLVELVTDAVRHSRQDGSGTIWIDLKRRNAKHFELLVRDNSEADIGPVAEPQMARTLAQSLGAELCMNRCAGFSASVRIPAAAIRCAPRKA